MLPSDHLFSLINFLFSNPNLLFDHELDLIRFDST